MDENDRKSKAQAESVRKRLDREHKKRMKGSQAKRRNAQLKEVVELLSSNILEGDEDDVKKIADLYRPIQNVHKDFWTSVPDVLSPHGASLNLAIAPEALLKGEEARQNKFRKKLEQQVKCGTITEAEAEEKLEKFGRPKQENGGVESPSFSLLNSDRGLRKRLQVENIASVLSDHFGQISSSSCQNSGSSHQRKNSLVVDFGCGSGNLCLALAAAFPQTTFLLTDRNSQSLELVSKRAAQGGLTNVLTKYFSFAWDNLDCFASEVMSEQGHSWDLGIGLHCCGAFTDMVLELCRRSDSDCLVAPCCNGKMHQHFLEEEAARVEAHTLEEEMVLEEESARVEAEEKECLNFYPRSKLFSTLLSRQQYWALSRAADDDNHYPAKCLVEYDRARGQEESNAKVSLLIMEPPSASPKHHVIYCSRS